MPGIVGAFTYQLAGRRAAASEETKDTVQKATGSYRITKRGRFWEVLDAEGALICLTAYKKGAAEVVRRLTTS